MTDVHDVDAAAPGDDERLTVDDLARISGVPSRTIRFYRQTGLLPPPRRVGRRAYYDQSQAERLRIIGELRERGLGLDSIAKILDEPHGEHVSAIVGITEELRRPWTEDRSADMTRDEVIETLGIEREHSFENLVAYEVIQPIEGTAGEWGGERYHVPSVITLQLAGELKFTGMAPEFMFDAWQAMQRNLSTLAAELTELYAGQFAGADDALDQILDSLPVARQVALRAVDQLFAVAMQRALADFIEQGGVLALSRRDAGDTGAEGVAGDGGAPPRA